MFPEGLKKLSRSGRPCPGHCASREKDSLASFGKPIPGEPFRHPPLFIREERGVLGKGTGIAVYRFPAHFKEHPGGIYTERADGITEPAQAALKGHDLSFFRAGVVAIGDLLRRAVFFQETALLPAQATVRACLRYMRYDLPERRANGCLLHSR